jgi:hypothetical protein
MVSIGNLRVNGAPEGATFGHALEAARRTAAGNFRPSTSAGRPVRRRGAAARSHLVRTTPSRCSKRAMAVQRAQQRIVPR